MVESVKLIDWDRKKGASTQTHTLKQTWTEGNKYERKSETTKTKQLHPFHIDFFDYQIIIDPK